MKTGVLEISVAGKESSIFSLECLNLNGNIKNK
jgi:hypothetical protein